MWLMDLCLACFYVYWSEGLGVPRWEHLRFDRGMERVETEAFKAMTTLTIYKSTIYVLFLNEVLDWQLELLYFDLHTISLAFTLYNY